MPKPVSIQIVSDVVCPWCYIGKRRLEKALAARPNVQAEITWLPFQLSPDMPREGMDRQARYAAIFGEERARVIVERMRDTAAADGLAFQTKPGARSPNTLSAHVLLHWASQMPGVDQSALAEKLFAAHHVDCEDIGNHEVLARIAGEVGMDPAEVLSGLKAGTDEDAVLSLTEEAREAGVSGVPFFIVNGEYGLSGAQPPEAIIELIDQVTRADASQADGAPTSLEERI